MFGFVFGVLDKCKFFSICLYVIQGFSERLVTTSRPAIGLMFKQVGIFLILIFLSRIM